jgi:hypothetical protein
MLYALRAKWLPKCQLLKNKPSYLESPMCRMASERRMLQEASDHSAPSAPDHMPPPTTRLHTVSPRAASPR